MFTYMIETRYRTHGHFMDRSVDVQAKNGKNRGLMIIRVGIADFTSWLDFNCFSAGYKIVQIAELAVLRVFSTYS